MCKTNKLKTTSVLDLRFTKSFIKLCKCSFRKEKNLGNRLNIKKENTPQKQTFFHQHFSQQEQSETACLCYS